jgi:hypothetical protein
MKSHFVQIVSLGLLISGLALTGCKSTDTADQGNQASVIIAGHTEAEVLKTTIEVMQWDGYKHTSDLTFEKEGSKWDTRKYGGLMGDAVWIKMKFTLTANSDRYILLGCDAYVIEDRNSVLTETEREIRYGKRSECKKILDQINQRLSLPAPKPH